MFEGCQLETQAAICAARLSLMHEGGVSVVVIQPGGASLAAISQYAAAAHGLGMSVMWSIGDPQWWQQPPTATGASSNFPSFSAACGCSDNASLLAYVVRWLSNLPGTYGYYAADDSVLQPTDQAAVAAYVAQIKLQDSARPIMIAAMDQSQRQRYQGIADLLGQEMYPVTNDPVYSTWTSGWMGQTAAETQAVADGAGKSSAFILQSFSWGDSVADGTAIGVCTAADTPASCGARLIYPTAAEQLELRDAVLRNAHPKLIIWYSFSGTYGPAGTPDPGAIVPTAAEAASRWAGLSGVITAPFPSASPPPASSGPSSTSVSHRPVATAARTCPRVARLHLLSAVSRNLRSAKVTVNGTKAKVSRMLEVTITFAKYPGITSIVVKIDGRLKNHRRIKRAKIYQNHC